MAHWVEWAENLSRAIAPQLEVFFWLYSIKAFLSSILMIIYVIQLNTAEQYVRNNRSFDEIERKISTATSLFEFLAQFGFSLRFLGVAAISGGFMFIALLTIHISIEKLLRRKIVHVRNQGFYQFVRDFETECAQLSQRVEVHIGKVMSSLLQYKKLLLRYGTIYGWQKIDPAYAKYATVENPSKVARDLDCQYEYLRRLLSDKRQVWPIIRNKRWHKISINVYLACLLFGHLSFWITGTFGILLTIIITRFEMSVFPDPTLRFFTRMDQFDVLCQYLFILHAADRFCEPMAYALAYYFEQYWATYAMREKLLAYNKKLVELREIHTYFEANWALVSPEAPENKEDLFGAQFIAHHQDACDSEALKLYISLQIFADELKMFFIQSEYSTVNTLLAALITNLVLVALITRVKFGLMFNVMLVFCIAITNAIIYLPALANRQGIAITQVGWSIIANAESFVRHQSQKHSPSSAGQRLLPAQSSAGTRYLVNPHTLLLWRRLIVDHESLAETFSAKLFGFARLDFGTILELNFWFVSLVVSLIVFSGR